MRNFILIFVAFTINLLCVGQSIKNFTILPSSPTTTDIIKVATRVEFTSNANLVSSYTAQTNNVIDIHRCYSLGLLTIIDAKIDTLTLGSLNSGTYTVNYLGVLTNTNNNCSPPGNTFDSTITFVVIGPTNLSEKEKLDLRNVIYPNPAHDKVYIRSDNNVFGNFKIYDCLGNLVLEKDNFKTTEPILIDKLAEGFYLLHFSSKGGILTTHKFLKN
ncbi:MAG: T9SS type A sorting domain-containing protein [Bacteroidia bacterium]